MFVISCQGSLQEPLMRWWMHRSPFGYEGFHVCEQDFANRIWRPDQLLDRIFPSVRLPCLPNSTGSTGHHLQTSPGHPHHCPGSYLHVRWIRTGRTPQFSTGGRSLLSEEVLAKLNKTVTPAKAGGQNVLKRLDSCFRRNDGEGLLQEALRKWDFRGMHGPRLLFHGSSYRNSRLFSRL